ncbi:Ing1-like protein [Scheffersomyces coipomensis]|uniref:Ing1-like protein n=1 Tax=Scheffersomyces coipomensis TaxID=1788519 RepID=UPI00315C5FCF
MDTSSVLEKYTQDLSNLPLEIRHLLEEIRNKDVQVLEARKRYQAKDNQLHKFIRANGTLTKHPKESQLYSKIEEDMKLVQKLQKEKILLSNTALFLVSKHLFHFETDIAKLERDELLPLVETSFEDGDSGFKNEINNALNGISESLSATPTSRTGTAQGTPAVESIKKQQQKRKQTITIKGTISTSRPLKRVKSEEVEDNNNNSNNNNNNNIRIKLTSGPDNGSSLGSGLSHGSSLNLMGGNGGENGPSNNGEDADNNLYCFCQRVSFGEMIGCDNDDCKYEWFHWSCVGITSPPKDDEIWYCPDCAPKMEKRKKKRKV